MKSSRRFLWILFGIALAGLALRLGVGAQLAAWHGGANSVFHPPATTDLATYMALSRQVAEGTFHGEFDYQPFYYAVFLAGLHLIFGASVWAVILAQSLLGAATIFLTGLIGRRLGGRLAGILAAALTALASTLVLYTPFHAIVTLQSFWVALALWGTLRAAAHRSWSGFAAAGLIAGCGILTRGNFYFFVPVILAAAAWRARGRGRRRFGRAAAQTLSVLILLVVVQVPFIWRNTAVRGELTGASTASGKVLALGNTPEAPPGGCNPGLPAGPMEYPPTWDSWMATEREVSVPARIFAWFREEPGAVIELQFRKALLFWDYREIPNNIGFHVDPELWAQTGPGQADQSSLLYLAAIPTGVLLALGLAGILLTLGKCFRRPAWPFAIATGWVAAYWLGTAAFYNLARFRAPILPVLAVFAGVLLALLWRRFRNGRLTPTWRGWTLALLTGVFIVYFSNDLYRNNFEAAMMRLVRPDGVHGKLADGREMRLDNGPVSFGGWRLLELRRGTRLEKRFARLPDAPGQDEVAVTFQAATAGRLLLKINGRTETVAFPRPGEVVRKFPVALDANDAVTLEVLSVSGSITLPVDFQRDYGRTRVDGEAFPAEAVMRLYRTER